MSRGVLAGLGNHCIASWVTIFVLTCSRERCVQSGNHCIASMLSCHCDLFCAAVTEIMSRPYWWPRPPPIYWEHQARRWCIIVTRALLQRARRRQKNGSDGSRRERPTISTVTRLKPYEFLRSHQTSGCPAPTYDSRIHALLNLYTSTPR